MLMEPSITELSQDKHLIIDTRPYLDRQCKITQWQDGIRFYSFDNNRWILENIEPGLVLINDANLQIKDSPIASFIKQIPVSVLNQIKSYNYHQFSLLQLLSHYPVLLDIFEHSPHIVWLGVIRGRELKLSIHDLAHLLQQRRTAILSRLYNNDSPKAIKFIQKMQLRNGDSHEYKLIHQALNDNTLINRFAHWQQLPIQVLGAAIKYPEIIETFIFKNFISTDRGIYKNNATLGKVWKYISDMKNMAEVLGITLPAHYFQQFDSKPQLKDAHDALVFQLNGSSKINQLGNIDFPLCPLGDDENYIQIKTSTGLAMEGREMRHCVASYIRQAQNGNDFFYMVLKPERGTARLTVKKKSIEILEFKLIQNQNPSEDSWFALKQWISDKEEQLKFSA